MKMIFTALFVLFVNSTIHASDILFDKGIFYLKNKNYRKSKEIFEDLIKKKPKNSLYFFNLGNSCFMLRDLDCALYAFKKVVSHKSPLSPAAFLYISKSLAMKDKYENAISILTGLKKQRLPDYLNKMVSEEIPNQYIDYVLKLISESKFKKALNVLKRLENFSKTDLQKDKAFLLRAIVLMNLNKLHEAKKYFIKVKQKSSYSDLKIQAESFLKIIQPDKDSFSQVWSNMVFELGENSNIFGTGGEDVKTRGLFSKISFYGAFSLYGSGKFTIGSNYNFSWIEFLKLPENRLITGWFGIPFVFSYKNSRLYLEPSLALQVLEIYRYQKKPGVSTGFSQFIKNSFELKMKYEYALYSPWQDVYNYIDGYMDIKKIGLRYFKKIFSIEALYVLIEENLKSIVYDTGDILPVSYKAKGTELTFWLIPLPFLTLGLEIKFFEKNYFPESEPGGKIRKDKQFTLGSKNYYKFNKKWSMFFSMDYIKNTSTLGINDVSDKNYDQYILSTGIKKELF